MYSVASLTCNNPFCHYDVGVCPGSWCRETEAKMEEDDQTLTPLDKCTHGLFPGECECHEE